MKMSLSHILQNYVLDPKDTFVLGFTNLGQNVRHGLAPVAACFGPTLPSSHTANR